MSVIASPVALGSGAVAAIGVLIPVVILLAITSVPVYFRMSERRRQRQGQAQVQVQRSQHDLAAEVEQMRRDQADG